MSKEWNEIVQMIAPRQKHLQAFKIDDLRLMVVGDPKDDFSVVKEKCGKLSKEALIALILFEEFSWETW